VAHFLRNNGFLLAAAISYQSLFAMFSAIYTAFAIVGIWLGGSASAMSGLISIINSTFRASSARRRVRPRHRGGRRRDRSAIRQRAGHHRCRRLRRRAVDRDRLRHVHPPRRARHLRAAVRHPQLRAAEARDFLAAAMFGLALLVGGTRRRHDGGDRGDLRLLRLEGLVGMGLDRRPSRIGAVAFVINTAALAALIRFLTGTSLRWRLILPGAALGGGALVVLQLGAGLLLFYSPPTLCSPRSRCSSGSCCGSASSAS
jgi:membrane protein